MRILLLGAGGFIGRELLAALQARGHAVVPVVRPGSTPPAFASEAAIEADLGRDLDPAAWSPRLRGIDAVVNCAGILQDSRRESSDAIHVRAPAALYHACEACGVHRVVLISAISADEDAGTAYAATKLAGEEALRATRLDWVVLRPSLVHARGAHGGTALLRALAALPGIIPVPGDGRQSFQPIHVDDLAGVVAKAVESGALVRRTLEPVGPDIVTLRAMLADYRRWLGLRPAPVVGIPRPLAAIAARVGDAAGGPLNSTALTQLEHGNTGDYAAFTRDAGIAALGWRAALALHPAHAQDRWHARMYFVRPLLRVALALLWLLSGAIGFFAVERWASMLASQAGLAIATARVLLAAACACDLALAALVISRWRPLASAAIQAIFILGYTTTATVLWPQLWADPLGPLAKNLPILAAVAALAAIEDGR